MNRGKDAPAVPLDTFGIRASASANTETAMGINARRATSGTITPTGAKSILKTATVTKSGMEQPVTANPDSMKSAPATVSLTVGPTKN